MKFDEYLQKSSTNKLLDPLVYFHPEGGCDQIKKISILKIIDKIDRAMLTALFGTENAS